jgi:LacI family transcriptional regulator
LGQVLEDERTVATISDVAAAAGVSPATVSRVLSRRASVNAEMASRVWKAVKDLDYRPSGIARSLRTRQSRVWGVIVSDIRNPFYTDLLRGLEDTAQEAGYALVIGNADERPDKESSYLDLFLAERVGGVVMSSASRDHAEVARLINQGIPVVAIDREMPDIAVDAVLADNEGGAYQAVSHLLSQGFHRIACITGPADRPTAMHRLAGFMRAYKDYRLNVDPLLVRHADFKVAGGYVTAYDLLTRANPPDALFVTNNLMTVGVLEAAAQLKLRNPRDFALVGFDEMPLANLLPSPLTTVAQPAYEMGGMAAKMLINRAAGDLGPARRVVLPVDLRIRATSLRTAHLPGGNQGTAEEYTDAIVATAELPQSPQGSLG